MSASVPIWFDALHVGNVDVATNGDLSLQYTGRWLHTQGAFPLSITMPLRAEPYRSQIITPWLANLLAEGEQLQALTRLSGLDQADELAILEKVGGDTAGGLSFGKPVDPGRWAYTPLTTFYGTHDPSEALHRHFEDLARRPFLVGVEGVRQSLAGGQRKTALAVLDSGGTPVLRLPEQGDVLAIPRNGAPSTLIVKPDNPSLPGITENEVWCLRMAQAIGIKAAEATVLQATRRRTAVCVLRYDRGLGRNGQIQRIHQEDFAQANGFPPGRKYERGLLRGVDLKTLLNTGRYLCAADALALLDQVIFNILVANTDAHAKNYALLLPLAKGPRLAPLYDVSTVLSWSHIVKVYAQNIAGRKRRFDSIAGRHWDTLARDAGYRPANVRARVRKLVDLIVANRVRITEEIAQIPGVTTGYAAQTAEAVEGNALRMAGRL